MPVTLLIDLDDTLLVNNMEQFLPAYLHKLSAALSNHVPPQKMLPALMKATEDMIQNQRPDLTLRQVFDRSFFPVLGLDRAKSQADIDDFYVNTFPTLKSVTEPRPEAIQLVETALTRGYQVLIATNPLFPYTAVAQRLTWAGLSEDEYAYAYVPGYEKAHFAKPSPAYFAEMLAILGWPDGPVVMVGDDFELDIAPAAQLGIPGFWTPVPGASVTPGKTSVARHVGTLDQVIPWLDSQNPDSLRIDHNLLMTIMSTIRSTPAVLDLIADQTDPQQWAVSSSQDEWSLTEILCHLRDVEREVQQPRIKKVLNESHPFLAAHDTDRWSVERNYAEQSGIEALAAFMQARIETLQILDDLSEKDWDRTARHSIFGPTTLRELVGFLAGHDRLHLKQIRQQIPL